MRCRGLTIVLALCACGRLGFDPGETQVDAADDDDDDDEAEDSPRCASPGDGNPFDSGMQCQPWATTVSRATVVASGGILIVTPETNATANGRCRMTVSLTSDGVFAEVGQTLPASVTSGATFLQLASGSSVLEFNVTAGSILAVEDTTTIDSRPYDAVAMRWWRIRPIGDHVTFETSADARKWTKHAKSQASAPATVNVEIGARIDTPESTTGEAHFQGVNVCP